MSTQCIVQRDFANFSWRWNKRSASLLDGARDCRWERMVCGGVFVHGHYRFRKRALLVPSWCDLIPAIRNKRMYIHRRIVLSMSGSTPRSNDPKAKVVTSVLSARLKQRWKTDLEWQLIPAQLKEVSCMHNWVHKIL